jgi:hypothetical protein
MNIKVTIAGTVTVNTSIHNVNSLFEDSDAKVINRLIAVNIFSSDPASKKSITEENGVKYCLEFV